MPPPLKRASGSLFDIIMSGWCDSDWEGIGGDGGGDGGGGASASASPTGEAEGREWRGVESVRLIDWLDGWWNNDEEKQ